MKTLLYGGNDPLVIKNLKENLDVRCTIHSIDGLDKDFSNYDLVRDNFKKTPSFDSEGQKIYQKFFEENFTRFCTMIVRRGLFLSDFHDLRDEFSLYFYSILEILKSRDIQLVLFFNLPHDGVDFILYKLAKILNIKTVLLYQSIFSNRFFIFKDLSDIGKIKTNQSFKNVSKNIIDLDSSYLKTVVKLNLKKDVNLNSSISTFFSSKRKFKFIIIKILNLIGIMKRKNPQKEYKDNLESIKIGKEELEKILNSKKKKIYFPLHFQPELSTTLLGNEFDDQILILERLCNFVGNDWLIIIKDNPRQTFYQRGKFFFKRIKYLKNIYFVDSDYDSINLIKKLMLQLLPQEALDGRRSKIRRKH